MNVLVLLLKLAMCRYIDRLYELVRQREIRQIFITEYVIKNSIIKKSVIKKSFITRTHRKLS